MDSGALTTQDSCLRNGSDTEERKVVGRGDEATGLGRMFK
jgi:hypothetical protein